MPRFYLHICNGNGFAEDEEGVELTDASAARDRAIDSLRCMMAGELRSGILNMASFIEIEDEDHHLVMTVPFTETVTIHYRA